jgi:glycerol-3-phosphate acyltransferase PlsY
VSAVFSGLAIGALFGSVPFAWLLHRIATGRDLRREGSGNPGAANVERSDGMAWAAVALALDAGKGAAGVLVARHFAGEVACAPAALGAVLAHVFTPWLALRGGKGVATALGAFSVLAPIATAAALAVFAIVVAVTRFVSLGSVLGAATLPIAIALDGPRGRAAAAAFAIFLVIAWRHAGNFARMRAGTEPRLGGRASDRGGAAR